QDHTKYGELSEYHHKELKDFISKLADHKFLDKRKVGNYAYVLEMSKKGEVFLSDEEELPLIVLPRKTEAYEAANKSSDEVSFEMYQDGNTVEEIAEERDLKASTIYGHLETFVESGDLSAGEIVDEESLRIIMEHLESDAVDLSGEVYLSNIKDALPDDITYDEIKIVLAEVQDD
ncbi:MAG: helix-turn-helix domain-containing protein, partial [bacterium]